ncbi:MAG: synthase assembly protein [Gammaproteobacteria bacterium]|nr:synthase assembly protein [Gammaproteobacteria bacterium]
MRDGVNHPVKRYAYKFIAVQALIGLSISLLCYIAFDQAAAYSALLGAAVAVIANVIFANKAFAITGNGRAKQVVNNFYKAEIIKIIISAILFTVCFRYGHVKGSAFFVSYFILQMSLWLAPLFLKSHNRT